MFQLFTVHDASQGEYNYLVIDFNDAIVQFCAILYTLSLNCNQQSAHVDIYYVLGDDLRPKLFT